jgi:putative colanic acid biosynthesis acetyltransferase WcaF
MSSRATNKKLTSANKILRVVWNLTWLIFFRLSPRPFHAWRCFLLKLFGAKIGRRAHPYPSVKVWAPWNLTMGDDSCLADHVDCYCVDQILIGSRSTVSQYSFLCTASHDYSLSHLPLVAAPIIIGSDVWITADVFIGPGVNVANGAVIIARSTVFDDVLPWSVYGGHPARFIRKRPYKAVNSNE